MDNFSTLAMDFGLRPQGKAAPMSRPSSGGDRPPVFDDVYTASNATSSFSDFDYDSIFKSSSSVTKNNSNNSNNNINDYSNISSNNRPVYDKPVYDEDIFDGLPGVKAKSGSSSVSYDENVFATVLNEKPNRNYSVEKKRDSARVSFDENVFATMAKEGLNRNRNQSVGFDDLLENLGRSEKSGSNSNNNGMEGFDDLLPGFGVTSPQRSSRSESESSQSKKASVNSAKPASSVTDDDPFVVLESTSSPGNSSPKVFLDPLDEISKLSTSANTKANSSSAGRVVFDDIGPLDGFGNSAPSVSYEINKEDAPSRAESSDDTTQHTFRTEPTGKFHKMPDENFQEFHENVFDMPNISTSSRNFGDQMASPSYVNVEFNETNSDAVMSPGSDVHLDSSDDAWLTVSEIPLFTQPTSAPPPFRPPPPVPCRPETGIYHSNARKKENEFSSSSSYSHYSQSPKPSRSTVKSNMVSPIDELENFAMGGTKHNNRKYTDTRGNEEVDANSSAAASAAAMKEAMDRAEAKFRHAKEMREREHAKTYRNKEPMQVEKDEQVMPDEQEEEERLQRERRQREEEEERRRLERERERARVEREKAKQAVERATREARERAAIEARERAAAETRRKSEKSVVERVQAEARERATRAAVHRVQAEARERAAADAKEKAEKAAAEAKERANVEMRDKAAANARAEAEARRKAERAAVDRAAAEARERTASAARMSQQRNDNAKINQQQRNDNDRESFFSMNSRPSSAPRPRANASDPVKVGAEGTNRTSSVNTSANLRKTSSATNFFDDLNSVLGGTSSSGNFQEVNGETEERRRARLDRHQRTQERTAKAVAEVNQRDLQSQRDQEERNRIGGTLDIEIKRWAAGKEGNLRALLSTLQYVLWPECGWTPVSLTDLITGASVKSVYRKAIVCVHPDKVQQKGANLQQKYIAEKVFDLLKEAWNKFNSEELF